MKYFFIASLFALVLISFEVKPQDTIPDVFTDLEEELRGELPYFDGPSIGGRHKTANGTLKALVVFVRFSGDNVSTTNWPTPSALPDWASNFVSQNIPQNNIYSYLNLSNFFDRCSGGDGAGNLGLFQFIGDTYYVTTDQPRSAYQDDGSVVDHVLAKLDNPNGAYNLDFTQYDNWRFQVNGELYNHEYVPEEGDGTIDYLICIWRENNILFSGLANFGGGYRGLAGVNFQSNDGVTINDFCGSMTFNAKNKNLPDVIGNPAHEYGHYLFGGSQGSGHFDGAPYPEAYNRGRINRFGLMCATNAGWLSGYERYRLGWLNPTVITTNQSYFNLRDSHVENTALILPLRYENNLLKEYYFIENYHTLNDYPQANPFLTDDSKIFNNHLTHGLLVYHVENEEYNLATQTEINIESADGRWQWKLIQGANTPSIQSDDLFDKDYPTYNSGFDERLSITIAVPPYTYQNYKCLKPELGIAGACYQRNDLLGDNEDLFRIGYNDVLSKYSNPAASLKNGAMADVGFEILGYNPTTKEYSLSLQVNNAGVLSMKPSKPQNLKVNQSSNNHPLLTWFVNTETDLVNYKIYKKVSAEFGWQYLASTTSNSFEDVTESYSTQGPQANMHNIYYRITAMDNQNKESVPSDEVSALVVGAPLEKQNSDNSNSNPEIYLLNQNNPNPFNPTTLISYQIPNAGRVVLKVYDLLGKEITTLVNEEKETGRYTVNFDASALSSGVYLYEIVVNDYRAVKKLMVIK